MSDWAAFAGFAGVVLFGLLVLSHASKHLVSDGETHPSGQNTDECEVAAPPAGDAVREPHTEPQPSTATLLVNVAISQGLFATLLLVGAWYAEIPPVAFGVDGVTLQAVTLGCGLGGALYAVNEIGAAIGERLGLGSSEELREQLAPETAAGWAVLLFVVLPVIAGFEELLFRGALVGVLSYGFGYSPWLLAGVSSAAFALGHGAQGPGGIAVTGALGFVLAAAFILSGSLLVVVVAHYLVNALEFVVHEGLGIEWSTARG